MKTHHKTNTKKPLKKNEPNLYSPQKKNPAKKNLRTT